MIARSILLSLLAASVAGFDYFVSRGDGKGVCVSDEREHMRKDLVPLYNLENDTLPGDREEKWTDEWRVRNLTIETEATSEIELNHKIVTTDGSERFKSIVKGIPFHGPKFLLLATEATLLLSEKEDWRQGQTFRVHLNQRAHPDQERFVTWAEYCTKDGKCEQLETLEDNTKGNILSQGRSWTYLRVRWDFPGFTLQAANSRTLVKWNTNDKMDLLPNFLFARTDSRRGVFRVSLKTLLLLVEGRRENELSRSVRVGRDKNLCLDITWAGSGEFGWGRFELLDPSGRVEHQGLLKKRGWNTRLNFNLDQGGDFTLRLLDVTDNIHHIGACPDYFKVWSPADGCYVYEGNFSEPPTAKLFAARLNKNLQVDLTDDQMREVCTALEVEPDSKLLFSSRRGAAYVQCPRP